MTRLYPSILAAILGVLIALPFPLFSATYRPPASSIADGSITSAKIDDGTIVNADISSSANINTSKINFAGVTNTEALAAGAPYSLIASSTDGSLSWQPSTNIVKAYSNEGTDTASIYNIPVSAGTKLLIFASNQRDDACGNASGNSLADVKLKQSTYAATTTLEQLSLGGNGANGCSAAYSYMHTSTTTETIALRIETVQATINRSVLTVLRIPF